ncbi:MAG: hydrogenase iron-sulfur subunit [Pseudomonadota bacterium]
MSNDLKILGITCNWSPFACLNAAARSGAEIPKSLSVIRVMCIGRINQALILRAFESGADGVLLLGCHDEDCRYGPGPQMGERNVQLVRMLLRMLGIGQKRLVDLRFSANNHQALVESLWDFYRVIERIGPNPAKPRAPREAT